MTNDSVENFYKDILPEDLDHATCLMDEQLDMIADYFTAKGVDTATVQQIKDGAKTHLQDSVVSSCIMWYGPYRMVA